jgi:hypothetical protein
MMAILRYAILKTRRDGTFWIFLLVPGFIPAASLIGSSFHRATGFTYPLVMESSWNATRNATLAASIATVMCALISAVPAFWALRAEVASKSIGSIALAVRPIVIVLSTILYSTAIAFLGWCIAIVVIAALTTALPSQLAVIGAKVLLAALTMGSLGVLAVTISADPPMIIGIYLAALFTVSWFEKAKITPLLLVPLAASALFTAFAAFLLERRCAR